MKYRGLGWVPQHPSVAGSSIYPEGPACCSASEYAVELRE